MNEFFHQYWEIFTNPAHFAAEVTFTVLIDFIFLGIIWPVVRRAIRHEHRVIDAEHGYRHDEPLGPVDDPYWNVTVPFVLTDKGWNA